jgi:tetratricopeptide (TPR) repeat protein
VATLTDLTLFYSRAQNGRLAASVTQVVLECTDDAQTRAGAYLRLGQLAEEEDRIPLAHQYYLEGLALGPRGKAVAYLLNNNTGYCLNALARSKEAEHYCRLAIEIDPDRYNAYKNLGISLERQGDPEGAARAYIDATRIEPLDSRAFHLLEQLLANHREVGSRFPGILKELEAQRRAADTAPER